MSVTESVRPDGSTSALAGPQHAARTEVACAHCGLPVPLGRIEGTDSAQFCCAGCDTAYAILHASGLDQYYRFSERREAPVRATGRTYEEFDDPTFHSLYVKPLPSGRAEVELYLEGVHCASCVWLVERVPLLAAGVVSAELEIRRSLARVVWEPASVALSSVARTLDSLGYPPHPFRGVQREIVRRREDRAMLARIGVAGAIAGNVMLAALALYSGWLSGMEHEYERFFRWLSLLLVTPALAYPGRVFFAGAWSALRARTLHMDVPIAVGLAAGYVQGAVNTIRDSGPVYFDGLATLVFFLLVGRYLQQRGQRAAADSAELVYSLMPSSARVVGADDAVREVPREALLAGMVIDVRPGDTLAGDGVVTRGESQLDMSLLTGESRPTRVGVGTAAFAGTVNLSSPIRVQLSAAGETTRVAQVMRQVEESARRRAPVVDTANRMAAWFVGIVLALAALTFALWYPRDPAGAVNHAIALLIVTCPCALALSTPLAVSMAIGRAARAGIFIKGGDALERLAHPGVLFLDKTGTVTQGRTALLTWYGPDSVKPLVLALESESSHPVARALCAAWPSIAAPCASVSEHVAGAGIAGRVQEHDVVVGSPPFVATRAPDANVRAWESRIAPELTPVLVAVDGDIVAAAGIGDPLRVDARASIEALRARGWRTSILSGDAPSVVQSVGGALGFSPDACAGGASPEDKVATVERARGDGTVVMVGDGINDAAAMAVASVGIGVHGGAEACLATADIYLTQPGLDPLVQLVTGATRTMRVIRRNLAFSLVYNVIGASFAVAGVLNPLIAAILMPASSLTVVVASWRSRTFIATHR